MWLVIQIYNCIIIQKYTKNKCQTEVKTAKVKKLLNHRHLLLWTQMLDILN